MPEEGFPKQTDVVCYGYIVRRLNKRQWQVLDPETAEEVAECPSYLCAEEIARENIKQRPTL